MSQVIYRRGWCPGCARDTVMRVRQEALADGSWGEEQVDCTECQEVIDT